MDYVVARLVKMATCILATRNLNVVSKQLKQYLNYKVSCRQQKHRRIAIQRLRRLRNLHLKTQYAIKLANEKNRQIKAYNEALKIGILALQKLQSGEMQQRPPKGSVLEEQPFWKKHTLHCQCKVPHGRPNWRYLPPEVLRRLTIFKSQLCNPRKFKKQTQNELDSKSTKTYILRDKISISDLDIPTMDYHRAIEDYCIDFPSYIEPPMEFRDVQTMSPAYSEDEWQVFLDDICQTISVFEMESKSVSVTMEDLSPSVQKSNFWHIFFYKIDYGIPKSGKDRVYVDIYILGESKLNEASEIWETIRGKYQKDLGQFLRNFELYQIPENIETVPPTIDSEEEYQDAFQDFRMEDIQDYLPDVEDEEAPVEYQEDVQDPKTETSTSYVTAVEDQESWNVEQYQKDFQDPNCFKRADEEDWYIFYYEIDPTIPKHEVGRIFVMTYIVASPKGTENPEIPSPKMWKPPPLFCHEVEVEEVEQVEENKEVQEVKELQDEANLDQGSLDNIYMFDFQSEVDRIYKETFIHDESYETLTTSIDDKECQEDHQDFTNQEYMKVLPDLWSKEQSFSNSSVENQGDWCASCNHDSQSEFMMESNERLTTSFEESTSRTEEYQEHHQDFRNQEYLNPRPDLWSTDHSFSTTSVEYERDWCASCNHETDSLSMMVSHETLRTPFEDSPSETEECQENLQDFRDLEYRNVQPDLWPTDCSCSTTSVETKEDWHAPCNHKIREDLQDFRDQEYRNVQPDVCSTDHSFSTTSVETKEDWHASSCNHNSQFLSGLASSFDYSPSRTKESQEDHQDFRDQEYGNVQPDWWSTDESCSMASEETSCNHSSQFLSRLKMESTFDYSPPKRKTKPRISVKPPVRDHKISMLRCDLHQEYLKTQYMDGPQSSRESPSTTSEDPPSVLHTRSPGRQEVRQTLSPATQEALETLCPCGYKVQHTCSPGRHAYMHELWILSSCHKTRRNDHEMPNAEVKKNRTPSHSSGSMDHNWMGLTFGDRRQSLLRWCKHKLRNYDISMYDFTESWQSGRALVALIHCYRKDLIEERFLTEESQRNTLVYGAQTAKDLGVKGTKNFVIECSKKRPSQFVIMPFVEHLRTCLRATRSRY